MLKQLRRSIQLGRLARDLSGLRRKDGDVAQARQRVIQRLGTMHGLPQKIGQLLSLSELTQRDQPFTALTESQQVLPEGQARALVEHHLGRGISEVFDRFDAKGIGGSLGQVHRGVLKDGRAVAVKIQYPDIAETLALDLKALGWLTAPIGGLRKGFDKHAYQLEVGTMLTRELDYRHEADMIRTFAQFTTDWEGVVVPDVVDELSGDRILTMTWLEGERCPAVRQWSEEDRGQLARILLRLFLTSCFRWGYVHADPHPGNYRFLRREDRVVVGLLDFGCVKEVSRERAAALASLINVAGDPNIQNRRQEILARYLALGFDPDLMEPMAHLLPSLTRMLFAPFHGRQPFAVASWPLGEQVARLLGGFRWNFRFAGPADLLFFLRTYQGLIRYLEALAVPIDWSEILGECVDAGTESLPPQTVVTRSEEGIVKSDRLRIRVSDGGETKVELTFAAVVAARLSDLVPDELRASLEERAIDVEQLAKDAVARDYEPGRLFELTEGSKTVRVWLE